MMAAAACRWPSQLRDTAIAAQPDKCAVHMWVQDALGSIPTQATRDADMVVNPVFVTPDPKLPGVMSLATYEKAFAPG